MAEEEMEYESDPEEAKMSLKMRRREASDDEEEIEMESSHPRVGIVDSEGESDGQGGAADYNEEDEDEEDEEYYDEQEGEYEERENSGVGGGGGVGGGYGGGGGIEAEDWGGANTVEGTDEGNELMGESENLSKGEDGEEEKKENEPFAVPTSGAFYMHDDRFRDNAGGRNRRTFGGRKLWESKDERKWGHDKFEEMSMHDRNYEEGRRSSKGYYRGRGRGRGTDRGYARGNRMRGYGDNNYQNVAPNNVKGRGPRRYQPSMKNKSETIPLYNKQSVKSIERTSHTGSGRNTSTTNQNIEHEPVPARKVPSSLSSASPPFYPSGSSSNDTTLTQKEVHAGNHNSNPRTSVVDQNFSMPLSNTSVRGKNVIDSIGMEKLYIDDSVSPASVKHLNNVQLPSSASSSLSTNQMPQSRAQGRGVVLSGSTMSHPVQSNNQVNKVSPSATQAPQRNLVQNRGQPSLQASGQQMGQRSIGASQGSSPPRTGKGTVQGAGRGSHVYGGAQVMGSGGNMGAGHGDQNLPAFFPVMQFGAQRPGGIGVPAVGMAFPGYVAQPNGLGNSEMTWLPVLASAAGALGASYCPPYLAVDGTYHPRPTGQTSALPAPSKDNNMSKPNNEVKPRQRSEVSNDEFNQRQNKPRRYSEMNFSQ